MADNNTPAWQQVGDALGVPGIAAAMYGAAKRAPSLLRYFGRAAAGAAAVPAAGATAFLYGMQPTEANKGEQPLYVPNDQGQLVPNMNNPTVRQLMKTNPQPAAAWQPNGNQPLSPMPAVSPWPLQQNGMNPQGPPPPPTMATPPAPAAPAPMVSTQPAQMANVPLPQPRPPMQTAMSARTVAPPMNITPTAPVAQTPPPANFYNGPASLNFGMSGITGTNDNWNGPNSPMVQRFLTALQFGAKGNPPQTQQPSPQQSPGLFPRMAGDIQNVMRLFGGGSGGATAASAAPTILGALY